MLFLFPLSFGMALDRLREHQISTNAFLISCVFPFAFIIEVLVHHKGTKIVRDKEEEKCAKTILELEENLFDVKSNGIRWPVIQLYRMLLIILVNTFVLNPSSNVCGFSSYLLRSLDTIGTDYHSDIHFWISCSVSLQQVSLLSTCVAFLQRFQQSVTYHFCLIWIRVWQYYGMLSWDSLLLFLFLFLCGKCGRSIASSEIRDLELLTTKEKIWTFCE